MIKKGKYAAFVRRAVLVAFILLAVFWILPVVWVLLNSFKTNDEFVRSYSGFQGPWEYLSRILPERINFTSYQQLFGTKDGITVIANFPSMIQNSMIVAFTQTVTVLIITSLSAYAYERLPFKNGDKIFWTIFYISLFPSAVNILSLFRICYSLGWVNNIHALIWPRVTGVLNIFLLRNFMKSIPRELDEAARIDGAGSFGIYRYVILPSITPVLIVVGLFAFNAAWNDYLWPVIIMNEPTNQTLTSGLRLLKGQYEYSLWTNLLACCILSMLLPLALYMFAQKYFLQGISVQAAVKG